MSGLLDEFMAGVTGVPLPPCDAAKYDYIVCWQDKNGLHMMVVKAAGHDEARALAGAPSRALVGRITATTAP